MAYGILMTMVSAKLANDLISTLEVDSQSESSIKKQILAVREKVQGPLKIHLVGNGCDRRLLDSEKLKHFFQENQCILTKTSKEADFVFINTCAMSQNQEDTSVNLIKRHQDHGAKVIVHGCLPQIAPTRFKTEFDGDIIGVTSLEEIDGGFTDLKIKLKDIPEPSNLFQDQSFISKLRSKFSLSWTFFHICWVALKFKFKNFSTPLHPRMREGAYLQISKGCTEPCTYCAIPKAVGNRVFSKTIEECVQQYIDIIKSGKNTMIFTADNVGLWGLENDQSLPELLNVLDKVEGSEDMKWILSELHPKYAVDYQDEILKYIKSGRIQELCIPIQSGNQRVLNMMGRKTNLDLTLDCIKKFRAANPKLNLNTDVLIGFPSESDEEFLDTIKFLGRAEFTQAQLFAYSDREGTRAILMSEEKKHNQATILRRLRLAMKQLDRTNTGYVFQ